MKINHFAPAGDINPIKPNLVRHSLGEGGFKRGTYAARLGYGDNEGEQK